MRRLLACALGLALFAGCRDRAPAPPPPPPVIPTSLAAPAQGAYTGAYLDFGDYEDDVTLEQIDAFEQAVGKHQAIVAFSSYWGRQTFPAAAMNIVSRHGSVPLVYWSPWDRPYEQDHAPDKFSLDAIVAGKWDTYIDAWADAAKAYERPFFVAWGLEMNGTWFPWSGYRYDGAKQLAPGLYAGPELYKRAYRHVVDRVRARGARNILWVFQANNQNAPDEPWNRMRNYYPGDDYVDWLGLSAYGIQFHDGPWISVEDTFARPYEELCAINPTKPVMLAEWGLADYPQFGDKARWITDALAFMQQKMPRLKAAVFWNERWENPDGTYSNLRVTSSPAAVEAYRRAVSAPFWLPEPVFR